MSEIQISDRYQVKQRLGTGSYGDVFLCLDLKLGRHVAIKLMKGSHNEVLAQQDAQLFRREAKMLALLNHEHIVRIYDYDMADDGAMYLVMEYLDGKVLSDLKLPLDMELISRFVVQIGLALHSAHEHGLIHRDLKPANVMYIHRGELDSRFVLLDLGVAKLMRASQGIVSSTIRNTTLGGVVGTALYMAPEQVEEADVDARTDVYAFGSTLFELLTGVAPFAHITGGLYTLLNAVKSAAPRRLSDIWVPDADFPPDLEELIEQCLKKEPAERPASMRIVVERYQAIIANQHAARREAERQRLIQDELIKATIRPAPTPDLETLKDTATNDSTTQDRWATQTPRVKISEGNQRQPKWAEHGTPTRYAGLVTAILVLIVPAFALALWIWTSPPAGPIPLTIESIPEVKIPEGRKWSYQVPVTIARGRLPELHFALGGNAPEGLQIDQSGLLNWTPTERQGPGDYPIVVEVSASGTAYKGASAEFTVHVSEVNNAPKLAAVPDQLILPGQSLKFKVLAQDDDLPEQPLIYSLSHAPPQAQLNSASGELTWAPTAEQLGKDFHFELNVSDGSTTNSPPPKRVHVLFLKSARIEYPAELKRPPLQISLAKNPLGMELVLLEPIEFQMGSPTSEPNRQPDELLHQVQLTQRWLISRHEVTVGQFGKFVSAKSYTTEAERAKSDTATWRSAFARQGGQTNDHPVVCVSWNDAVAFCQWLSATEGLNYRLPTEAEWEFACRANQTTPFLSGSTEQSLQGFANLLDQSVFDKQRLSDENQTLLNEGDRKLAVAWDDGFPLTAPAGRFQPNGFGICDMSGNVWEWCGDRYQSAYDQNSVDPTGPEAGDLRIVRGGSWLSQPRDARSATRDARPPTTHELNIGFRIVRVP